LAGRGGFSLGKRKTPFLKGKKGERKVRMRPKNTTGLGRRRVIGWSVLDQRHQPKPGEREGPPFVDEKGERGKREGMTRRKGKKKKPLQSFFCRGVSGC